MKTLRSPKDVSQMRSFLGLGNVYRRFLSVFPKIAAPSKKKLKKGEPNKFVLEKQVQQAMAEVKNQLMIPLVLALRQLKGQYTVDTDASDTQVGCVLLQEKKS